MDKETLIRKFDKQAQKYDRQRQREANRIWRKKIFDSVQGRTLEVAVGAGMNFSFLPSTIEYTGVDFSQAMLEKAQNAAKHYPFSSEFILSEVEALSFPEDSFDTIMSSGTLCSYENPVEVLNLFNQWGKKDGQILLLEHGLFDNHILSWLQKRLDPIFFKTLGCHQNRNILDIVNQSKLDLVKYEKGMHGYLSLIWAKPSK